MAISIYEEILSAQPNHTKGLLNLAALYHERFFIEDAIDIYSRALATVPSYQKDCLRYLQQENDLFTGGVPSPFSFADHVNVTSFHSITMLILTETALFHLPSWNNVWINKTCVA